jgi:hypothetical protein
MPSRIGSRAHVPGTRDSDSVTDSTLLMGVPGARDVCAESLHKHKHACNQNPRFGGSLEGCGCSRQQVLEVASFVPGHVLNRGATSVLDGSLFERTKTQRY